MNQNIDKKYHDKALEALHQGLHKLDIDEKNIYLKKELVEAFIYSGNILRGNHSDEHVRIVADSVFETCIRLARCLFFPQEARFIVLQGKEYQLDTESQTDALRRNMDYLKEIA